MNSTKLFNLQQVEINKLFTQIDHNQVEILAKLIIQKHNDNNSVYFCGVGKSENIGSHTADLLKSIGIKAYSLSPLNALHGDLGVVRENDLIILYSNSGNTKELIDSVNFFKKHKCHLFGVFGNEKAKLNIFCDDVLILPMGQEIDKHFELIPTTSFLCYAILGNILVCLCVEGIGLTIEKYGKNHPAGSIGKMSMLTVSDVMNPINNYPQLHIDTIIKDVILKMTEMKTGICLIYENNEFVGIFTDGDLRRATLEHGEKTFGMKLKDVKINTKFQSIKDPNSVLGTIKKYIDKKYVPVLNNKEVIGILEDY